MSDEPTQADLGTSANLVARPRAVLIVVHHPEASRLGVAVPLRREQVLGRGTGTFGPGSMDDALLSRRHLSLRWSGRKGRLLDLGSLNGVTRNGERVRESELAFGDVVGLGGMLLLVAERPVVPESEPGRLLGRSAGLAEVLRQVDLVAPRDTPVLVLGETGTGKELVARELHDRSGRPGPFVALNCGAVGDELVHSELFGHTRGAFTGAGRPREGLVRAAAGGTLFLDEIGEASPSFQVALLRLLQEGEYRPVGADRASKADVRVVAATHKNLGTGEFREDLAARLGRWPIPIPALRERPEDIPLLARHFAARHAERPVTLSRGLVVALLHHGWPGNVRELDAAMERIVVGAEGAERLRRPPWLAQPQAAPARERPRADELRRALMATRGNMVGLARRYGVSRNTLYRWFRDQGLDLDALRAELRK